MMIPAFRTPVATRRTVGFLLAWVAAAFALAIQALSPQPSNAFLAAEAAVLVIAGVITMSLCAPTGFWSPAAIYLLVLGVFHVGLAPYWVLGVDPVLPRSADYDWFDGRFGGEALILVSTAIVAYVLVAIAVLSFDRPARGFHVLTFDRDVAATTYSLIGALLLILSVVAWFAISISEVGIGGLIGSYTEFLAATVSTELPLVYVGIGFGVGLSVISRPGILGWIALGLFGAFASVGFFLGLRGEVLFPAAVGLTVVAFRRRMPHAAVATGLMVIALALISAAKQIRQQGVAATTLDWQQISPLGALGELGSTIRVVATVLQWHDVPGQEFRGGDTYTVSIFRALERFDPVPRPSAADDFRLFNAEIADRAGAIGGSAVAEAYHNFALVGVVVVMALLGLVFARFSYSDISPTGIAAYVVVAIPLFNHVRNSFVPVIPTVAGGLALIAATWLIARALSPRRVAKPVWSPRP